MEFEDFEEPETVRSYLHFLTSHFYSFAIISNRRWGKKNKVEHGTFWQLMSDGEDDGFFDWYCYVREDYQFFKTKEICILYFIKYWTEWNRRGKPNWEGSRRHLVI
jgi:hypothetical protein